MPKNRRRIGPVRRALVLTAVTVVAGAFVSTAGASARVSALKARASQSLPVQGIFGQCDLDAELATCEQNLLAMHQAGLQVVVQTAGNSLANLSAFAQYAQSIGMSIMWEIDNPSFWGGVGNPMTEDFPGFAAACACDTAQQVLDYMIHWLAALPATYGYYAADADDEAIDAGNLSNVSQYVDEIKADDPNHMVMMGTRDSQGTSLYGSGAAMGNEIYPETTSDLMPYARHPDAWLGVQQSVTQDARAARADGEPSVFVLQSFTFGDNLWDGEAVDVCTAQMTQAQCASKLDFPSEATQLELRNEVLRYAQPKLILWFNFDETYGQGNRWANLTNVVNTPYPEIATVARAKRSAGRRAHRAKPRRRPKTVRHTRRRAAHAKTSHRKARKQHRHIARRGRAQLQAAHMAHGLQI